LTAKVDNARDSALLAPPAERQAAWERVVEWQEELAQVTKKLDLLEAIRNEPALSKFQAWWESVKENVLLVPWCDSRPKSGSTGLGALSGFYTDKALLRTLLERLGFEVRVWWEKNDKRRGRSEFLYVVKDVEMGVSVNLGSEGFVDSHASTTGYPR
jgi:hypothetical protein